MDEEPFENFSIFSGRLLTDICGILPFRSIQILLVKIRSTITRLLSRMFAQKVSNKRFFACHRCPVSRPTHLNSQNRQNSKHHTETGLLSPATLYIIRNFRELSNSACLHSIKIHWKSPFWVRVQIRHDFRLDFSQNRL